MILIYWSLQVISKTLSGEILNDIMLFMSEIEHFNVLLIQSRFIR